MEKLKHRVNLRSLAKELGLSPMTVSRALNGSPSVKDETRMRILSAAREFGYDANLSLRGLQASRKRNVAIHCGAEKHGNGGFFEFFVQLHYYCLSSLKSKGLSARTVDLNADGGREIGSISECGGLVILSPLHPEIWERLKLERPDLKSVCVFGEIDGPSQASPDELGGGELAAKHLARLGHSHVAFFSDLNERSFRLRYGGFVAEMAHLVPDARIDLVQFRNVPLKEEADFNRERALDAYLSSCNGSLPSAFFSPNCYSAVFLYQQLKRRGVSVPDDVGLLGYDNIDYYDMISDGGLSRVYFEIKDLAALAASTLAGFLSGEGVGEGVSLLAPVKFLDKGSVLPIGAMRRSR